MSELIVRRNKHGVPYLIGPRTAGPHTNVWDHLDVGPGDRTPRGLAIVCCDACGAEWPEGGEYPASCEAR